jgi:tetratricopeptide (TPR) repeat protein
MPSDLDDLFSNPNFRRRLLQRIEDGWTFEKIEPMSTGEIFARLNRLGVPITPEGFRQAAQGHESAERVADVWRKQYPLEPEGPYDEDFLWMAAIVLWKRLIPDRVSFEQIDDRMQEGYELLEQGRTAEACDAWWQVWEWLKEKVRPERNTLQALDRDFRGMQAVFNWCQDFAMELENAGMGDPTYYRMRIRYCREFLDTFSGIDWWMRGNFLGAEAESYWRLGEIETAEARFEALIAANPDWPWGYVGWSDEYWLSRQSPKEYNRAERILLQALDRPGLEEREVVIERLEHLRAERAQAGGKKRRRKRRRRK